MSRGYRSVRPKANRVYSVKQVLELYQICRNTLSNWVTAGLRPVDDGYFHLFRGTELRRFHANRAAGSGRPLHPGEFKCVKCKACVVPATSVTTLDYREGRVHWARSVCPDCCRSVQKMLNETTYDTLKRCIESNTSLHTLGEEEGAAPVGVWTNRAAERPRWVSENERTIHAYQIFGGKYDAKTLDAHLAAIRDFEAFHALKPLSAIKPGDAARYRDNLTNGRFNGLSLSTIRHRASYLSAFFAWLVQQDGFRRMNKTVCDNFALPKALHAKALQTVRRAFPTTQELNLLIAKMPAGTRVHRRDRAIVVLSFLAGTRSSATSSIFLGSVDVQRKIVVQDATVMRIKNGKSQTTRWFPIGAHLEKVLVDWIEEQSALGYGPMDALFPPDADLCLVRLLSGSNDRIIEPWKTDQGVRRAFRVGCERAGLPYFNPHSAKRYLVSVRDEYCRTPEQRKAWSYNLGHEHEQITETSYAKMNDHRRNDAFDKLMAGDIETEAEKDLLLAYHEHRLSQGTPDFDLAERLHEERRKRLRRE